MAKIVTVQGVNEPDELKRQAAMEILNEQETIVLERVAELAQSDKAVQYIKGFLTWPLVKKTVGINH